MTNKEKLMHMTIAEIKDTYGLSMTTISEFFCKPITCEKCPGNNHYHCKDVLAKWLDAEAEDMKMTEGDRIRRMSDRELAVWRDTLDREAWENGAGGGSMKFGKTNIDFWTGYFGHPADEDYEG